MAGRNCAPPPPPDVPTCEAVVGLSESSCDRSECELWESLSLESAGLASGACCCCRRPPALVVLVPVLVEYMGDDCGNDRDRIAQEIFPSVLVR